jgi:hypothetical protein
MVTTPQGDQCPVATSNSGLCQLFVDPANLGVPVHGLPLVFDPTTMEQATSACLYPSVVDGSAIVGANAVQSFLVSPSDSSVCANMPGGVTAVSPVTTAAGPVCPNVTVAASQCTSIVNLTAL